MKTTKKFRQSMTRRIFTGASYALMGLHPDLEKKGTIVEFTVIIKPRGAMRYLRICEDYQVK